jgi:hypothetical protein
VIVVSGHDHNTFIDKDNIKQIISGAGSKSAARAINQMIFPMEKMDMLL